ncbi:acyl-CoA N-acyltransferase [Pholiota conissans]|uniref:Acyl-CoA N-acyltransferase n=1 Tax=Pholiota conissans TaxID=109636 RepID=A0A9P5YY56_9AGAR|nr:acyl-CoA N-acyltransferase [Pholiota conissans]
MCCVIETISPPDGSPSTSPSFVGIVALWINAERAHRHAKYTISLGPQFQNKGYGTKITKFMVEYGFQYLNLHRISAVIPDGNDAAVAVCKQSGFTDEGRERKARWQNGEWRDNILLGVLVDDWRRPKE